MDIYLHGEKLYGMKLWVYYVIVDHKNYDEFTSTTPLTHSQMIDVADGYREGLTNDQED